MTGLNFAKVPDDTKADNRAIAFLQGAIQAQSITGNETNFVNYLLPKMQALGLQPQTEEFADGRLNLWGGTKATENNSADNDNVLLVMGHTDTVHVKGWRDKWQGTARENPFSGAVIDGEIWGRGSGDLKAGICAWLMAWERLYSHNIQLKGELQFAFIGDEESGEAGMGTSEGVKHYVNNIAPTLSKPTFAVYTEPSQLNIYTAQMGFFIADIDIIGKTSYFGVPEQGIDALKAAHKVATNIFKHSNDIEQISPHELIGNPFALITDFRAGGYIAVPGDAHISLIRKLLPSENMDQAVKKLSDIVHEAIKGTGCECKIAFTAGRDHADGGLPSVTDPDIAEVQLLIDTVKNHWQKTGAVCAAPFWSEKSFLKHGLGCNAVYCAPGDITNCHTLEERVDIKQYLAAIKAFADFIAKYCCS
ncbi:MAG: M20/M25/M40 family metallo-hydrolase [Alphaproteobacteria bacterium]|nr:M20/M25/M40 family metallo-hydrolase [Alphaproteobacteria bacterium]